MVTSRMVQVGFGLSLVMFAVDELSNGRVFVQKAEGSSPRVDNVFLLQPIECLEQKEKLTNNYTTHAVVLLLR